MPYAAKINVCPCLTMTIPDKLDLMARLALTKERDPSSRQYYCDGLFYHPIIRRVRLGLVHDCAHDCMITSHPLTYIRVRVI